MHCNVRVTVANPNSHHPSPFVFSMDVDCVLCYFRNESLYEMWINLNFKGLNCCCINTIGLRGVTTWIQLETERWLFHDKMN
jgi:hypothetical protein